MNNNKISVDFPTTNKDFNEVIRTWKDSREKKQIKKWIEDKCGLYDYELLNNLFYIKMREMWEKRGEDD